MPALAANTAIIMWNTADPGGFESALGTDEADLALSNLGGITITASSVQKGTNPNDLTEANIGIRNTTDAVQVLRIIAGANGFFGPSDAFTLTGTVGGRLGGYDLTGSFFADQTNSLNGTGFSINGVDIGNFDSGNLLGPASFAFNGFGTDALTGSYGLAESLTLTLQPGATVFVQGMSMDASAVPEPSTWAMGILGFGLIAAMGWKRSRKDRLATI